MLGYLLFSHGSLLCGAGEALDGHALRLAERLAPYPVEAGYLNYSDPDVEVAVERLIARGAVKIIVIPYFLVPGYFVTHSLPKRLAQISERIRHVEFEIAGALGVDPRIADALADLILSARAPMLESADALAAAAASCRNRSDCPLYGSAHCPGAPGKEPSRPAIPGSRPTTPARGSAKTALLAMVHGSPHAEANAPMFEVIKQIEARAVFDCVAVGFMECNAPTIPDAIDLCAQAGVQTIIALPYFLHLGVHVALDLPALLKEGREKYPSLEILMTDYLGLSPKITDVLYDRAKAIA